jgi:hypothetical protein
MSIKLKLADRLVYDFLLLSDKAIVITALDRGLANLLA